MNLNWVRLCVIGFVASAVSGCALYEPHISDLALVSVEIVPARVLTTGKLRDSEPQIKITFSSEVDLVDIGQGKHFFSFPVYQETTLCKNFASGRGGEISIGGEVFWKGGGVNGSNTYYSHEDYSAELFRKFYPEFKEQKLKYYEAFSSIRHVMGVPHPIKVAFDLERQPEDLCLAVHGGDMLGATYRSNTVVVPKAAIAEAFREAAARGR